MSCVVYDKLAQLRLVSYHLAAEDRESFFQENMGSSNQVIGFTHAAHVKSHHFISATLICMACCYCLLLMCIFVVIVFMCFNSAGVARVVLLVEY